MIRRPGPALQSPAMEHRASSGRLLSDAALQRLSAVMRTPFGAVGIRTEALGTEDECIAEILYLPHAAPGVAPRDRLARAACEQISRYLRDPAQPFALPLKPLGTRFQRRVWAAVAEIPPGAVRSYGEVAQALRSGPRAVGQACGANWFPLVIPCHRVVASGGIGGFARNDQGFHIGIKRWLLAHEGIRLPA